MLETVEQPAIARLVAQATTPIVSRFLFEESFFLIGGGVAQMRHNAKHIASILLIFSNICDSGFKRFYGNFRVFGISGRTSLIFSDLWEFHRNACQRAEHRFRVQRAPLLTEIIVPLEIKRWPKKSGIIWKEKSRWGPSRRRKSGSVW